MQGVRVTLRHIAALVIARVRDVDARVNRAHESRVGRFGIECRPHAHHTQQRLGRRVTGPEIPHVGHRIATAIVRCGW